jgi:hypothetical protein
MHRTQAQIRRNLYNSFTESGRPDLLEAYRGVQRRYRTHGRPLIENKAFNEYDRSLQNAPAQRDLARDLEKNRDFQQRFGHLYPELHLPTYGKWGAGALGLGLSQYDIRREAKNLFGLEE